MFSLLVAYDGCCVWVLLLHSLICLCTVVFPLFCVMLSCLLLGFVKLFTCIFWVCYLPVFSVNLLY